MCIEVITQNTLFRIEGGKYAYWDNSQKHNFAPCSASPASHSPVTCCPEVASCCCVFFKYVCSTNGCLKDQFAKPQFLALWQAGFFFFNVLCMVYWGKTHTYFILQDRIDFLSGKTFTVNTNSAPQSVVEFLRCNAAVSVLNYKQCKSCDLSGELPFNRITARPKFG